jgi:hypothetical protein
MQSNIVKRVKNLLIDCILPVAFAREDASVFEDNLTRKRIHLTKDQLDILLHGESASQSTTLRREINIPSIASQLTSVVDINQIATTLEEFVLHPVVFIICQLLDIKIIRAHDPTNFAVDFSHYISNDFADDLYDREKFIRGAFMMVFDKLPNAAAPRSGFVSIDEVTRISGKTLQQRGSFEPEIIDELRLDPFVEKYTVITRGPRYDSNKDLITANDDLQRNVLSSKLRRSAVVNAKEEVDPILVAGAIGGVLATVVATVALIAGA